VRQRDERVVIRSTGVDTRRPPEGQLRRLPPNYMEYIALMLGSGTRLKAVPTEPTSPPFPPDPLGWMAV